jgi:hypothetical protein
LNSPTCLKSPCLWSPVMICIFLAKQFMKCASELSVTERLGCRCLWYRNCSELDCGSWGWSRHWWNAFGMFTWWFLLKAFLLVSPIC